MGNIIQINFKNGRMTLTESREFLGHNFFKQALIVWSIEELESTTNHPEGILTGACYAYEAILQYRLRNTSNKPMAQVIYLNQKKAA